MTDPVRIRPARVEDAEAMSAVLRQIIAVTGRERPSDRETVLARYIQHPARLQCSVAQDAQGRVLGFQSLIRATAGNPYDVPEGWGIIGTHISPQAHRLGIGKALFAASRQAAIAAGLEKIDAYIGADNPAGLRYYEAMGFCTYREPAGIVQKCFVVTRAPSEAT